MEGWRKGGRERGRVKVSEIDGGREGMRDGEIARVREEGEGWRKRKQERER